MDELLLREINLLINSNLSIDFINEL